MIDGFKYCITDYGDRNIMVDIMLLMTTNIIIYLLALTRLIDKV